MRSIAKLAPLAAAGLLAVAVPAMAKTHPAHPQHPNHPSDSHKCIAHNAAYTASGTFVSWAASQTGPGTYTGTITIDVKRANHHANTEKGTTATYTLTDTKVRFGKGANPPSAGDPVKVIGKITEVAKKCTDQSTSGTVTLRKVDIRAPKAKP